MKNKEKTIENIFFIASIISIVLVLLIFLFMIINTIPIIEKIGLKNFILGSKWAPTDSPAKFGIYPMIIGSLIITLGSIIIGGPIGIFTAIYLSYYSKRKTYNFLKLSISLLAGIPSIIYGFFGLVFIVPAIRNFFGKTGNSILTASILLGIMILPTIISLSEASLSSVDKKYYEGALALGVNHDYAIKKVVIPMAKSGMLTSIILGIGRAIGETMAVIMVAGNQARMPSDILDGVRTMTSNIVIEMGYASGLHRNALIATGAILFLFVFLINFILFLYKRST